MPVQGLFSIGGAAVAACAAALAIPAAEAAGPHVFRLPGT
jgi:hypothetical protein